MESPVKERLRSFIKAKGISERKFCLSVGLSTTFVSNMRKSILPETVELIWKTYPDLNTGWLLTGRGSMFAEDLAVQSEESNGQSDIEKELIQLRQEKQELLNTVMRLNERITCLNDTITRLNMQIHDMMFSGESSRHDAV